MRYLSADTSLDVLRREAKRWLRAIRSGDPSAIQRMKAAGHPPIRPSLRGVQHALAAEYGFAGWTALKARVEQLRWSAASSNDLVSEFLELACLNYGVRPGTATWDRTFADRAERRIAAGHIMDRHPQAIESSLHAAAAAGNVAAVRRLLSTRPGSASEPGGPHRWPPLLFVSFSRVPGPLSENGVEIARMLLDHGADPNVHFTDGGNRFTPLTGAMGEGEAVPSAQPPHPQSRELAQLLLDRGADPFDRQGLYNTALWNPSTEWLELLFERSVRAGQEAAWTRREDGPRMIDVLLDMAVTRNHVDRVRWLVEHGADAASPGFYSKRPLHQAAVLRGYSRVASVLERAGAPVTELSTDESFQVACLSGDEPDARRIAATNPGVLRQAGCLMIAAESGNLRGLELMLDLGVDPNAEGWHHSGRRALHGAAFANAPDAARLLLDRGAEVDPVERAFGASPLGWAVHHGHVEVVAVLAPVSRDLVALTGGGCIDRLRELFAQEPALARSELLFQLPATDERALETAEFLVAAGADPEARNAQGRTAAEQAASRGLVDTAAFLDPS